MPSSDASLADIIYVAQTVGFAKPPKAPMQAQFSEPRKLAIIAIDLAQASISLNPSNAIDQFLRQISAAQWQRLPIASSTEGEPSDCDL